MPSIDEVKLCRVCFNPLRTGLNAIGVCEACVYNEGIRPKSITVKTPKYRRGSIENNGDEPSIE